MPIKKSIYYLYHIPGVKIGCSRQPEKRVKKQGFDNYEILEVFNDLQKASERELELQKEYGYKIDNTKYSQTISAPTLEGIKKGGKKFAEIGRKWLLNHPEHVKRNQILGGLKQGKIQGQKNKESGFISNLGKKSAEFNNRIQTCTHCGKTTRGVGYIRWHGDKCKLKINN